MLQRQLIGLQPIGQVCAGELKLFPVSGLEIFSKI